VETDPYVYSGRSNAFLLSIAAAGYLMLAITAYCFGRALFPPGANCDTPDCFDRPYAQDSAALLLFVPGALIGSLGLLQLWLIRRCRSAANARVLRMSFLGSAVASLGFCVSVPLAGAEDVGLLRGLLALTAFVCFLAGLGLAIVNVGWSLARREPESQSASKSTCMEP
jgi:hypothetical protein